MLLAAIIFMYYTQDSSFNPVWVKASEKIIQNGKHIGFMYASNIEDHIPEKLEYSPSFNTINTSKQVISGMSSREVIYAKSPETPWYKEVVGNIEHWYWHDGTEMKFINDKLNG